MDERLDQMECILIEKFEKNSCNCEKVRAREVGDQGHIFMHDEPMTREVGGEDNILMNDDETTREVGDPIDMMNDEVDLVEYYMTPPPTIVSDDDHLLNEDNELEEVTSKVDGRPFRKKKCSMFLQSPYTVPRKRFKYRRNFGL